MKISVLLFVSFFSLKSFAFPDMVRHGYTTCVTCHFSPSGGGLLNSYGKFIAGELLGTWNSSETALPWLVAPQDTPTYSAGIMARGAQVYTDTENVKKSTFKRMQLDVEAGLIRGPWYGFATVGMRGSSAQSEQEDTDLKLRSFYVGHGSVHHAVRVGRFYPEYGIRVPNHNLPTRKGLYWDQGDEPYVAQVSYYTTFLDYNLAYLMGAPETQLVDKYGVSGSLVAKTNNSRTGLSFLDMSNSAGRTYSRSFFSQIGYLEHGYTMFEFALKFDSKPNSKDAQKNLLFVESGWELWKGFIPYIGIQKTQVLSSDTEITATPIGFRFYPMTHAEIVCEYDPITVRSGSTTSSQTAAFAMFNIYF